MDVINKYQKCNIEIYKITKQIDNNIGMLDITDVEMNKIISKLDKLVTKNKLVKKKYTVYQHKLKELYVNNIEKNDITAYITTPIQAVIKDDYLINISKRRYIHCDTFPMLKDYDNISDIILYYNDNYEYRIINNNVLCFSFINNNQIKDFIEYMI